MKILYITNYDLMYGANKSLFYLMRYLKDHYNLEPYLLVPQGGDIGELCNKNNIRHLDMEFRISCIDENISHKLFRKMTRKVMRYIDFYKIYHEIKKRKLKFDIIHTNSSVTDIGYFLAKKFKIPHVWHIREFAKADYSLDSIFNDKEKAKKYKKSDAVIAISNAIQTSVQNLDKGINVTKIYNGLPIVPEYLKEYKRNSIVNFCIIGSIQEKKNQLDLIKAGELLVKNGRTNFRIYIVGDTQGEYYEKLLIYIENHKNIEKYIIWTGYIENVMLFLKNMDVGIMSSDAEAFGRVTVEYMMNYMPVIGTNTGGTSEIVGNSGKLYYPHDIRQLSKFMSDFIDNKEQLFIYGEKARRQGILFDADSNAEEIYRLYLQIQKNEAK